jgi:hypothetical protein
MVLRAPDEGTREKQYAQFVSDLRVALDCIKTPAGNSQLEHELAFH